MDESQAPVVIAGGGPVGLTLALVLAHHGIPSTVLERSVNPTRHPKMDLTNGRSMELFRSIGIAHELRAIGVSEDHSLDVVWATSPGGHELHRECYPSPAEQRRRARRANDGTDTTEPRLRVSQILVEPLLRSLVAANPLVDDRIGWAVTDVRQDQDGIVAIAHDERLRQTSEFAGRYLAGCDGGASTVRRCVDIELEGEFSIFQVCTHHFRSPARDVLASFGAVYHVQTPLGTLIAQDGGTTWTFHGGLRHDFDETKTDSETLLRERIGADIPVELLVDSYWWPHLAVAEHYRKDRVFLAGDAAHAFVPTGGYGMNTGIGDAFDLGWKLGAVLRGWAGPALLDSYEAERRPVARRNMRAAQHHNDVRGKVARAFRRAMAEGPLDDDDATDRRSKLSAEIVELYDGEYECWGIDYGYRYDASPVIVTNDLDEPTTLDWRHYQPTSAPGARLPALYLSDGTPLHDLIGTQLTLLVRHGADPTALARAADASGIPLTAVPLPDEDALELLGPRLLLVRPDHHVAWRADSCDEGAAAVIRRVAGWGAGA